MKRLLVVMTLMFSTYVSAQTVEEVRDSVQVRFEQSRSNLDLSLDDNGKKLDRLVDSINVNTKDSAYKLQKVLVVGSSSPEGSVEINKRLSEQRANVLFDYISARTYLPQDLREFRFDGRDWRGLLSMVEADNKVPNQDEAAALIKKIIAEVDSGISNAKQIKSLQYLRWGEPYWYMYQHFFPLLRRSELFVWYEKEIPEPEPEPVPEPKVVVEPEPQPVIEPQVVEEVKEEVVEAKVRRPFYMSIKNNLAYDALAVPNLGAEFYLGRNFSIVGNWQYAWWSKNSKNRFWRVYGGDLALRKWFGKAAKRKPLTGHHLGIYGQVLTYDFEKGGKGYLGGEPGGTIFDKCNYGGGIEYGYSLPIARRLNIDFTLGVGYFGGEYYEYVPKNDRYVVQATKSLNWVGPTKLEISLVWLIGCDNQNRKKADK
jgi:hypothetical protein